MTAYFIFIREEPTRDQAELDSYWRKLKDMQRDPNMKVGSMYATLQAVEGAEPDAVVLLEFPDAAAARAWYDSPAYQDAATHRQKSAYWRAILVEGVGKPR